jgi:hypothetical protein
MTPEELAARHPYLYHIVIETQRRITATSAMATKRVYDG